MTEEVPLALLLSLLCRSAQLLDMERVTRNAHKKDIIIGWDLSHSIRSVPHDFKMVGLDFAILSTYKHISGGPNSNVFLYTNRKHLATEPGLVG